MPKQNKPYTCRWFIKPIGDHTNEQVGQLITNLQLRGFNFYTEMVDTRGNPHRLIDVDSYTNAKHIIASQSNAHLRFEVFFKPKGWERVARWKLHIPKLTKRSQPQE